MMQIDGTKNTFSDSDDIGFYDPCRFDPEETFVDDEIDTDTLALRDAMRDITSHEGRFELLLT